MRDQPQPRRRAVPALRRSRWLAAGLAWAQRIAQRRTKVTTILAIGLGAAVGANLRYGLSIWAAQRWGTAFPYGCMLINVVVSFAMGLGMVLATTRLPIGNIWRLLIVTGFLGCFTTFS